MILHKSSVNYPLTNWWHTDEKGAIFPPMAQHPIHILDLDFQQQDFSIAAFLVELPEGPIVIETGPHSTLKSLEKGLADKGYKLEDIKHVLLTHIHLDHAGAAWCFAERGAKIYVHPFGYKHMHNPSKLLASAKMIYQEKMDSLWGTLKAIPEQQLQIVNHLEKYTLLGQKFVAHHTPGHAKHHIAWQMDDVVFAGDVAGVCINDGPVIPPCPPPDINREDWMQSIDHLLSLDEVRTYYITHFGRIDRVQSHMEKLRTTINEYADFIEPYARRGNSTDEVLPDFLAFANDHLVKNGLTQEEANAYQIANPPYMSVAGIMRYWKKKMDKEAEADLK